MDAKRLDGIDERVKKYYLAELQEVYAPTSLAIAVAERLEKERDDLQKQVAVMRKALGLAIEFADTKILAQRKDVQKIIVTALDTPPTAYDQRVRGLGDGLQAHQGGTA